MIRASAPCSERTTLGAGENANSGQLQQAREPRDRGHDQWGQSVNVFLCRRRAGASAPSSANSKGAAAGNFQVELQRIKELNDRLVHMVASHGSRSHHSNEIDHTMMHDGAIWLVPAKRTTDCSLCFQKLSGFDTAGGQSKLNSADLRPRGFLAIHSLQEPFECSRTRSSFVMKDTRKLSTRVASIVGESTSDTMYSQRGQRCGLHGNSRALGNRSPQVECRPFETSCACSAHHGLYMYMSRLHSPPFQPAAP
jgi:hypothetical protein